MAATNALYSAFECLNFDRIVAGKASIKADTVVDTPRMTSIKNAAHKASNTSDVKVDEAAVYRRGTGIV
jgi:hypothetical protein